MPTDQNTATCDVVPHCRNLVVEGCSALLHDMYSQVETAFLEAADNLTNQEEKIATRSAFMAAQASIEEQLEAISEHFKQQLELGFSIFCGEDTEQDYQGDITKSYGPEVESDIAIRKMAFECRNLYFKQLYELRHRMALIRGGRKIEEKGLPGGPTHIISSFHSAIAPLDLSRQIKTALYDLFNQHVMNELGHLYERYNDLLIEAGLFPNLKPITGRPPSEDLPEQAQAPADIETAEQTALPEEQGLPEIIPTEETEAESGQEDITAEIIEVLSQLQPITSTSIDALATMPETASMAEEIDKQITQDLHKHLLAENKQLLNSINPSRLSKLQASTIKLVTWIFEDIIDSPLLPGAAKALICNLHIPYLKVALLDQGFFNQSDHPARQLLNLMIRSAGQWVDEFNLQKGVYPKLSEATDRILFEFSDNAGLFDELLTECQECAQQLQHKTESVEQRAQESARGRDKLDSVRLMVANTIREYTQGRTLPTPIEKFLDGAWSDKLTLMLLRNAEATDSQEWQDALEIVDALSNLDPELAEETAEPRHRLSERIQQSMSQLGDYQSSDADILCRFLEGQEVETTQQAPAKTQADDTATNDTLSEKEQRILVKLKKIEPGTWFELTANSKKIHRVKLSWRSSTSNNHMFVDQTGAQVLTLTAAELTNALSEGQAHILGHHRIPFVDRAIKNIGDRLKDTDHTLEKQLSSGE